MKPVSSPASPCRVLVVDDHHLFNDGIKLLLGELPEFKVCGQVYRESDVLPAIQAHQPHLILLDVNLKGNNGIDLGKKIIQEFPSVRIVMLTMYNQPKLLEETRKAGIHGYILKDNTTQDLLRGLRTVMLGNTYYDERVASMADPVEDPFGDDFARRLNLTFREVEIIRLVREGFTTEEIAERLYISSFTVKTHRKNIHFKLGISKVTELIQFANQNGL
jgi:DNA-binding NarL/FixJ family response regulator